MASLSFTLLPEALLQLHDVLICLAKFSENVTLEAGYDFLCLTALNSTKSAYASFKFDSASFFSQYSFAVKRGAAAGIAVKSAGEKICCQIYIKALLSVFKGRTQDFRDKETAIERCEVQLRDSPDETKCRLVVQMICRHGVVKTSKLTYEDVKAQHAIFDKSKTENQWAIDSHFLREIIDHFGATAEQLDMYTENTRAVFTSLTAKVTNGNEILKQPVHTSVAIDTKDFDDCIVEEKLHVAISVKDFKAIVVHADSLKARLTARYTRPCRPLQLAYGVDGMVCEFTLMTRGEGGEPSASSSNGGRARELPARPSSRPVQIASAQRTESEEATRQQQPDNARSARPSPAIRPSAEALAPPQPSGPIDHDSLFVPADDDQQWDEPNYGDEDEDRLGWDANMDQDALRASLGGRIQDITPTAASIRQPGEMNEPDTAGIPPTQRISQIRGLFD